MMHGSSPRVADRFKHEIDPYQKPDRQGGLLSGLPLLTRGLQTPGFIWDWQSRSSLLCCARTGAANRVAGRP